MSGFAAEMPDDPGLAALTAMPKVVFSSTLQAPLTWADTELVDGDPSRLCRTFRTVQDMKRRDSRPLRTISSLSLCRSLLEAGVVDRFRVVIFPVITGATGKDRIFDGYPRHRPRLGRQPHVRRSAPVARVRSHGARMAARRRRLDVLALATVQSSHSRLAQHECSQCLLASPHMLP